MKEMQGLLKKLVSSKIAVFCGAGISFNSGVPVVNQIIRFTLQNLMVSEEDINKILSHHFPFEAFIEAVFMKEEELNEFTDIFSNSSPNATHKTIAALASKGIVKEIYTTNFDDLLEQSLTEVGVVYETYINENDFINIRESPGIVNIYKLHGCISQKESIRTTIRKIAGKQLSEKRFHILKHLFLNRLTDRVLIMGYSCSDFFDLTPQIQAVENSTKEILFIEHSNAFKTEPVNYREEKNPFSKFKGERIFINTDNLIENICTYTGIKYQFIKIQTAWQKIISNLISKWDKRKFNSRLYSFFSLVASDIILANKYNNHDYDPHNSNPNFDYFYHYNCAMASIELGNLTKAKINLQKADHLVSSCQMDDTILRKINIQIGYANYYFNEGNYTSSIKYAREALYLIKQNPQPNYFFLDSVNLHLANALSFNHQYHESLSFQIRSLKEAKNRGEIYAQAGLMIGISNNLYELHKLKWAKSYLQKALNFCRESGNIDAIQTCLTSIAVFYHVEGDMENCLNLLFKNLEVDIDRKNRLGETVTLSNIAETYIAVGDYEKAGIYNKTAQAISKEIDDFRGIITCLVREVVISIDYKKDFLTAYTKGKKCLALIDTGITTSNSKGNKRDLYYNLALSCLYLQHYSEALEYIHQALVYDQENKIYSQIEIDMQLLTEIQRIMNLL